MPSVFDLRAHAREIFFAGLRSADPIAAVRNTVQVHGHRLQVGDRSYDLDEIQKVLITGCGKAAAPMARAVEELLGDKASSGIVVVKYGHALPLKSTVVIEAGHPVPDQAGFDAARRIAQLMQTCGSSDLVFFLVSGGGSALLPYPANGLSLVDKQRTTEALLKSGAAIGEINAVRKHLSRLKGGRLAKLAAPAHVICLVLSDVIGDSFESIASGPTVPDTSTYNDCLQILDRYDLRARIPYAIVDHLERGARGEIEETPKASNAIFQRVQNIIVGSNRIALRSAAHRSEELGYHTLILSDAIEGESRIAARSFSKLLKEIAQTNKPVPRPACVISGGETVVTVRGDGLGGRNQEFALAAAIELEGVQGVVVLSAGTDGNDGPTDAAGAIIDGATVERARVKGLDPSIYLRRNDSYHFLQKTQDLFLTGPTLTNVMDLQVGLVS